jgi:hypothetical protein
MKKNNLFADLGLGILSWKGHDSLTSSLTSYKNAGFLDLFSEKLLFLPEIDGKGIQIAESFSMPHQGTPNNLGILGGFKALAESMTSKYLFLIENDFQLSSDSDNNATCSDALSRALYHLQTGESKVWRFRNLRTPGAPLQTSKVLKYWPSDNASLKNKLAAGGLRFLRPNKAHRLKGMTIYTSSAPAEKFPDVIKQLSSGDYLVRSDVLNWSNNMFLIERNFFLNSVIPIAESHIKDRLINGFPTIEIELNRSNWWRENKFWIGVSNPGLFTHDRKGDRGYI